MPRMARNALNMGDYKLLERQILPRDTLAAWGPLAWRNTSQSLRDMSKARWMGLGISFLDQLALRRRLVSSTATRAARFNKPLSSPSLNLSHLSNPSIPGRLSVS